MNFRERLIAARKAKGLSQESLGETLGLSRQAISKWETGDSKPDLDNLIALCEQLEISIEYLCFGQTVTAPPPEKKAPSPRIRTLVITGIAVVSMILGLVIGYMLPRKTELSPTEQNSFAMVNSLSVIEATVCYDHEINATILTFITNQILENSEVILLVEYDYSAETKQVACTLNDYSYSANLYLLPNCVYRVTAAIAYNGEQKLIPIMDVSVDDSHGYEYTHLWEE